MNLLTDHEGKLALQSARASVEYLVANIPRPDLKEPPVFDEKRGVFVTLTKEGCLRGCIGFPYPVIALGEAIREAAIAAASQDPRFPPVKRNELPSISIEVTVLTPPFLLTCAPDDRPANIVPGRHGLIVKGMGTSGLLLPQVCTDYQWDARTFLEQTCAKAGLPAHVWHNKNVEVMTFEGQIFSEHR